MFLNSSIFFWFFGFVSICLLTLLLCSCRPSAFSTSALIILIIIRITLNSVSSLSFRTLCPPVFLPFLDFYISVCLQISPISSLFRLRPFFRERHQGLKLWQSRWHLNLIFSSWIHQIPDPCRQLPTQTLLHSVDIPNCASAQPLSHS